MIHYDEYGVPTHEHEMLCLKSLEAANDVMKGDYITRLELVYGDGGMGVLFKVYFYGKKVKKGRRTVLKVWPIDHMASKNAELVDYAIDEIELELARKHVGWDKTTIVDTHLEKKRDYMILTFSIANK